MYTRSVEGRELELGVTGKLYKDALVMYDRETGTLWTQVDGSVLRGPLAGSKLQEVPAIQTTWKVWKQLYRDTIVLKKPADITGSRYDSYASDPDRLGLDGTRGEPQLPGKAIVVGVEIEGHSAAVPLPALQKRRVICFTLGGRQVVVFFSAEHRTATVFLAEIEGHAVRFRSVSRGGKARIEDEGTASLWSPLEGLALAGPLKGKKLKPLPHQSSYWYAWSSYRPKTTLVVKSSP